jgi:hypothetical protein
MALKAVVSDPTQIPEAARSLYVERDGAHWLDVEPVEHGGRKVALEDVTGLRNALGSQQSRADQAEARLRGFGDLTPEAARAAIEKADRLSKINPETEAAKLAAEHLKAAEEQYKAKLEAEKKPLEEQSKKYRAQLEKTLKSDALRRSLIANGAVPEDLDYLEFHASKYVEMVEQGDLLVPQVFDGNGRPRISMKPGSIDPMGIDELVASEIKPKFPRHFIGENASGSGSSQNGSANHNGGGGVRRIPAGDTKAINAHIKEIAEGKAIVV